METTIPTQEFSEKNSLYNVLYNFLLDYGIEFERRKADQLSKKFVQRYIELYGIVINGEQTILSKHKIISGDIVEIPNKGIAFCCLENNDYKDNDPKSDARNPKNTEPLINEKSNKVKEEGELKKPLKTINSIIDAKIEDFLIKNFDTLNIPNISHNEFRKAFCLIIQIFKTLGFDNIKKSKFSYDLTDFIKARLQDANLVKEFALSKQQLSGSGILIEKLLLVKAEKENELHLLISSLKNGQYDKTLFRFLQDYSKQINSSAFQYLLNPLLEKSLSSRVAIENLIKPINDAYSKNGVEEKYLHYEDNKYVFDNYLDNLNSNDEYNQGFFHDMFDHLLLLFREACETSNEKSALIKVESTTKKYNFSIADQCNYELFLFVSNQGEGLAKNLLIKSLSDKFVFDAINVGILKPGERREIKIYTQMKDSFTSDPSLDCQVSWEGISGKINTFSCSVSFALQDTNVPWEILEKQNLYTIQIIEDKNKLYGRDEILEELKANALSDNIVSYKIWGQKRVGKSSIVKTLKTILTDFESIIAVYRRIGGIRNPDPIKTLNDLGESLCSEVINEIDSKIKSSNTREQLKNISLPIFNGSLYPLENFLNKLHRIEKSLKFIFILDEFDRINDEFFMPGNLGEVLSQSIGKGLNEERYIGFILVGSENMQILDRQGMNYNSYREREVDTFSKLTQYSSYKNIVVGPGSPYLIFSEDSIDKIFDITNGNPYFTNLICYNAFKNAFKNRDSFIDIHNTQFAIELIVKSSQKGHFEHFWGDGLTEDGDSKKERKTDIRRRILVSFSRAYHLENNHFPSKGEIIKNFKYPTEYKIENYEVENVITEFYNRKIFYDIGNSVRIKPQLFESWLIGPGKTLMIEGVSDLEAQHKEMEMELAFALKDDEIKRLSDSLIYEGRKTTIEKFKDYFTQFGGSLEQRRIFNLLDSIYYISQAEINDFLRKEQKNIFSKKIIELKEGAKTIFREGIEIYTFSKNIDENKSIIDSFKFMSRIRTTKSVKNIKSDKDIWKKNNSTEIIIIEPIIDDFSDIQVELDEFLTKELLGSDIPVKLVVLIITNKAKTALIKATSTFPNFRLIVFKEIEETKIKPFVQGTELFENTDEVNQVFAAVRKVFPAVNKEALLVLMEQVCPSKSCPILWCKTPQFKPLFINIFGVLENQEKSPEPEQLRLRIYKANTELSQKLNGFIVDWLKNKAKTEGKDDWFRVEYIPKSVMESISTKWIQDSQTSLKESYFDFLDYKKIIQKDTALIKIFSLPGMDLTWCDKINILRRDPAHPEKPAPELVDVEYFEKIKTQILFRINQN